MKKIFKDKILNIEGTDIFDNAFLFEYLIPEINSPLNSLKNPHPNPLLKEKGIDQADQKTLTQSQADQKTLPQPLSKRGEQELFQNNLSQVDHRLPYNKSLRERRKELKQNLTIYEKIAWKDFLAPIQKEYGIRILQQRVIGNFIVDFYIASLGIVIEIDGESHFNDQGNQYDKERTEILEGYGLEVLRYSNEQIKHNLEGMKKQFLETFFDKSVPLSWRGARGEFISSSKGEGIQGGGCKKRGEFEYGRGEDGKKEQKKVEIIYIKDLLQKKKNIEILEKVKEKPAMYSEVYAPKDELKIFTELFENALQEKKKIHIVGVTLGEEIKMLEAYYKELGFMREDINAFDVDFSIPLVTVSCHIENLMWRGSDYKAQKSAIFFCPPIRESGQNKALFKGITRGVIAGIDFSQAVIARSDNDEAILQDSFTSFGMTAQQQEFIGDCIRGEKILPLHMGKVLKYNLEDIGFGRETGKLQVKY